MSFVVVVRYYNLENYKKAYEYYLKQCGEQIEQNVFRQVEPITFEEYCQQMTYSQILRFLDERGLL